MCATGRTLAGWLELSEPDGREGDRRRSQRDRQGLIGEGLESTGKECGLCAKHSGQPQEAVN